MNARFLPSFIVVVFLLITAYVTLANTPSLIVWHAPTEIATGPGERGPWRQNASRYDYVDDPTVAIDGKGEIAVAWVEQGQKDVMFQRFSKDGVKQGMSVNVSNSPEIFSWLPRVAIAPDDARRIYIIWQEIIFSGGSHGGDILFARSDDGGATFSAPVNLSRSVAGAGKGRLNKDIWSNGSFDLAAGADGLLYVTWTDYEGPLWLVRSSDAGKTFSPPQHIAGDQKLPARGPSLAIGSGRNVYLAWTVGEDPAAAIRVARSGDGGAVFAAPAIIAGVGHADAPKLALDPDGTLHLVYAQSPTGPLERYQIRHTRSRDGARSFDPAQDISMATINFSTGGGYPGIAIDGKGRLYVTWEIYPHPRQRPRGMAIGVSQDGGRSFSPPSAVQGSSDPGGGANGSHQGLLMQKLAVSRDGMIAVVNSSLQEGERSKVWLMRGALGRE